MTKEEIVNIVKGIRDPYGQKRTIYELMDELSIPYKKTNCKRCILDYYNIIREEVGLIESAAELSDAEYVYVQPRAVRWNGHILNQNTPKEIIEEFMSTGIKGIYIKKDENK